eukprot:4386442-Prymnesium_polylepis.2
MAINILTAKTPTRRSLQIWRSEGKPANIAFGARTLRSRATRQSGSPACAMPSGSRPAGWSAPIRGGAKSAQSPCWRAANPALCS